MSSKTAVIPFSGTAEQKEKLYEVMREWKGKGGALMPVLQEAQEIYGYLPIEDSVFRFLNWRQRWPGEPSKSNRKREWARRCVRRSIRAISIVPRLGTWRAQW